MIEIVVAVALVGGLLLSLELSYRLGRHAKQRGAEDKAQLGAIQGAVLGLLGLLLGFSFAGAAGRFIDRLDLMVSEANAIGTAYLRAGLLPDAPRARVQELLRRYTDIRIAAIGTTDSGQLDALIAESGKIHTQLWDVVVEAVKASPQLGVVVLPPVNEVIDLHTTRMSAGRRHLPPLLLAILIACSVVAVGSVGYACGLSGRRNLVFTSALAFLVSAVLWLVVDLDYPKRGLIRMGSEPLLELKESLAVDASPSSAAGARKPAPPVR